MAASDLRSKATVFLAVIAIVSALILVLPWFEAATISYLTDTFGIEQRSDGTPIYDTASDQTGVMGTTTVALFINLFKIVRIGLWMFLVIAIVRFIGFLIFSTALKSGGQAEIGSLLKTVLSIVIYIVAFFIIFQSHYPEVQLTPLFTGSTIVGIVVGLALQDTLGNLFAGIALQADQPFQVGDVISLANSDVTGVVETVSWRGVKIRTFQNKLLIISNAVLGKETIEIAQRDDLNARLVHFNTTYRFSPARTTQIVRHALRNVDNISPRKRPIVRIRELGQDGIEFEIKYWCTEYEKYNDTDAVIRQRIWYAFNREGIDFAYPTRTVFMENAPTGEPSEEQLSSVSDHLSNISVLGPLTDEELDRLARRSTQRVFAPGEVIVREGEPGSSMFVIMEGSVTVNLKEGERLRSVGTLETDEFFGEMSLLTGEPRSATVIAEEETSVLEIPKAAVGPILHDNPELAESIAEIVEKRREATKEAQTKTESTSTGQHQGVMHALRKFFGLRER